MLIISLLLLINLILNYLRLAKNLKKLELQLEESGVALSDIGYNLNLQLHGESVLTNYIEKKNQLWSQIRSDIYSFWNNLRPILTKSESDASSLNPTSDLYLKLSQNLTTIKETIHLYNQEILILNTKNQKPFFKFLNRTILKLDFDKLSLLQNN